MIYVEEAMEESADLKGVETGWDEIKIEVAKLVREAIKTTPGHKSSLMCPSSVQELVKAAQESKQIRQAAGISQSKLAQLESFVADADMRSRSLKEVTDELACIIRPRAVVNRATASIHAVAPRFGFTPWYWKTACGWRWPRSPAAEPVTEDTPLAGISVCGRCQKYFSMSKLPSNVAALVMASRSELQ